MERTVAQHTRDFARRFFALIEETNLHEWTPANEIFARAVATYPDHAYVAHVGADRVRKAGFARAAERIRQAEFPQIERRKAGIRKNAPVFYRIRPAGAALTLDLPYQTPASHPLRNLADRGVHPMRREPEDAESRAPLRRRLAARRIRLDAGERLPLVTTVWQSITAGAFTLVRSLLHPWPRQGS